MKHCCALLFLLGILTILGAQGTVPAAFSKHHHATPLKSNEALHTIAFGSCNDQNKDQSMWKAIVQNQPDLWIWLGDNIYADTENMKKMAAMYRKVLREPGYQKLRAQSPIIGIWDDHDYGVNDGDKTYPKRQESKNLMLNFLEIPKDNPVWQREGAYQSYTIGPVGKQVKVILLDGRYFRDELKTNPAGTPRYFVNEKGDMLGETQWQWLEAELSNSTAQLHLIGCGVQFIHDEHGFEKWANFPVARQRLFDLLAKIKPAKTILISGDRHISEVSKMELPSLGYPLYEFTSSGLTHSYTGNSTEPNRYRASPLVNQRSFGIIQIDWSEPLPKLTMEARGLGNVEFFKLAF